MKMKIGFGHFLKFGTFLDPLQSHSNIVQSVSQYVTIVLVYALGYSLQHFNWILQPVDLSLQ